MRTLANFFSRTRKCSLTSKSSTLFHEIRRKKALIAALLVLLLAASLLAITAGVYKITFVDVYLTVLKNLGFEIRMPLDYQIVVWEIRIPRVLLASCVGIALAVAGTVFQGIFRNPLVEPYLLGISAGAACGAALSIVVGISLISLQFTAFIFGIIATFITYSLATTERETPIINLILAGIVVNAIFTAVISYLKAIAAANQLQALTFWLLGGFYSANWDDVAAIFWQVILCTLIICSMGWRLNLMTMGDEEARSLGVDVKRTKALLLGLATFITSVSVATVGIIAWVGLIMPHIARMTIGPDHRYLLPAAAVMGGLFMVICDTIARTLVMGEIPISIVTSIIGAPYLMYLVRTNRSLYFR